LQLLFDYLLNFVDKNLYTIDKTHKKFDGGGVSTNPALPYVLQAEVLYDVQNAPNLLFPLGELTTLTQTPAGEGDTPFPFPLRRRLCTTPHLGACGASA